MLFPKERTECSALDTAQCNTTDDELGQQQINNDHRQDGNGHQHIDLAHIELEEVGTAELCNEDPQKCRVSRFRCKIPP